MSKVLGKGAERLVGTVNLTCRCSGDRAQYEVRKSTEGNSMIFKGKKLSILAIIVALFAMVHNVVAEPKVGDSLSSNAYRIGPEDILDISVWKEEDLQKKVLVRPDGGISFPLAGEIIAGGMTSLELQAEITKRIKKYIPDAVVTVSVAKIAGLQVYVLGKVNKPGQFTVGRYVDVIQALTLAGGVTPYADEDDIKVVRRDNGKEVTFPFDYSAVKKGKHLNQNIILRSGDVVIVP